MVGKRGQMGQDSANFRGAAVTKGVPAQLLSSIQQATEIFCFSFALRVILRGRSEKKGGIVALQQILGKELKIIY